MSYLYTEVQLDYCHVLFEKNFEIWCSAEVGRADPSHSLHSRVMAGEVSNTQHSHYLAINRAKLMP